jgi:hypothetical protein
MQYCPGYISSLRNFSPFPLLQLFTKGDFEFCLRKIVRSPIDNTNKIWRNETEFKGYTKI